VGELDQARLEPARGEFSRPGQDVGIGSIEEHPDPVIRPAHPTPHTHMLLGHLTRGGGLIQ